MPNSLMAYWYGQFLAEQLKRDDVGDAELCILAEIGRVLRRENYRELKKTEFNKLLMEEVKKHMRTDLKPRKSWLKKAGREYADREKGVAEEELKLPDVEIRSVYMRNFRSFGDGIHLEANEKKGTTLELVDANNAILKRAIVFGPNGSGKSSFCESMEWKLTDYIGECDRRGIALSQFCRRYSCVHDPEVEIKFEPNKALSPGQKRLAKSCFIEKNRIQGFALLAKGKGDKDVIALLIGLDDLKKIADDILVLPASCSIAKSDNLLVDAKNALESWKSATAEIERQIAAEKIRESDTAKELTTILHVNQNLCDTIGVRTKEHENDVARWKNGKNRLDKIYFLPLKKEDFADIFQAAIGLVAAREALKAKLMTQGSNVNYKELYTAVSALGTEGKTCCPACDTPLADVKKNPFDKAAEELPKLGELQRLQNELAENERLILSIFHRLVTIFDQLSTNQFAAVQQSTLELPDLHESISVFRGRYVSFISVCNELSDPEDVFVVLQRAIILVVGIARHLSAEIDQYATSQDQLNQEKIRMDDLWMAAEKKLLQLRQSHEAWVKAEQRMKQTTRNQQEHLQRKKGLEDAELIEQNKNGFLRKCGEAYASVHKQFLSFKHALERKRTETIQQRIAHYYQMINAGDSDAECVDSVVIQIPDGTNDQYAILLFCRDGSQRNAMHVLSEGHVRALGLAITLALAEKYALPFLIFDDAVNAIDSDHRANIIGMMFADEYLSHAQLLVTTHDRLFWERFCLELGKRQNDESVIPGASFVVTYPANGQGSVFAQYNVGFEQKIIAAMDHFDLRQAMVYLRIWLETEVLNYIDSLKGKDQRLSGRLHKSRRYRGNALEPDITGIFSKISSQMGKSVGGIPLFDQGAQDAWSFLRTELIDDVINQDNHAYSEALLNISHAKTSDEVREIFQKIKIVVTALQRSGRPPAATIAQAVLNTTEANLVSKLASP